MLSSWCVNFYLAGIKLAVLMKSGFGHVIVSRSGLVRNLGTCEMKAAAPHRTGLKGALTERLLLPGLLGTLYR